jgi:hypothetical protein
MRTQATQNPGTDKKPFFSRKYLICQQSAEDEWMLLLGISRQMMKWLIGNVQNNAL